MTAESRTIEEETEILLEMIRSGDAEGIALALDRIGDQYGTAAFSSITAALDPSLTETMLAALRARAQNLQTPQAWSQVATAAVLVGRDEITLEAASAALKLDPSTPNAAVMLSVAASRRGDHDEALRVLEELISRVPAAKDDPVVIFQTAAARLGRGEAKAALAILEVALPALTAAGLGLDAEMLHARALAAVPERVAEADALWHRILPTTTDRRKRVQLRVDQANSFVARGQWKAAAAHFDEALAEIQTDAHDTIERRMEIQALKVQALASHDIDSVMADLDELDASWKGPGWPPAIDVRFSGLVTAGRVPEALRWLEERINRTPALASHPAIYQLLGEAQIKLEKLPAAMRYYEQALEVPSRAGDVRALGARLMSAYFTQQWEAAKDAYETLRALDPGSASNQQVRVIAAMVYLRLGEFKTGLELTDGLEPTTPDLVLLLATTRAEIQLQLERFGDVLETTAVALKRSPTMPAAPGLAGLLASLHVLRAQAFNRCQEYEAARDAASAALNVGDEPGALQGVNTVLHIGARMQRSLALFKLGDKTEAHRDIDIAIKVFDPLRGSAILGVIARTPGFDSFESSLWFAKGALLHSESRSEEALGAYSQAVRLEKHGNVAAVAQGTALALTGAFAKAIDVFDSALAQASSADERAAALAGKGRALVRLGKFEEAITALQASLEARLIEPANDPDVFELLGIAYEALKRTAAAARAFRRAWNLTPEDKRSANLARGVSSAELDLKDPAAALEFLNELPGRLKDDRTLLFNRALALDALGRRPAAIHCLVKAKDAGLDRAQQVLDRLDAPAGLGRWTHYWFGAQAWQGRRAGGVALLLAAATGFAAPFFQWWIDGKLDWYLLLVPSAVALLLLALPNIKSIAVKAGDLSLEAEPVSATGRDAAVVTAPETFSIPVVSAPPAITPVEAKPLGV